MDTALARRTFALAGLVLGMAIGLPANAQTLGDALAQAWSRHPLAAPLDALEAQARARTEAAARVTPGPASASLATLDDRFDRNRGARKLELELGVPLWLPGQQGARLGEARELAAEIGARRDAVRLRIAGQVRDAWWMLAAARDTVELARQRVLSAQALESDVQRKFEAGERARMDANLARSERVAAQSDEVDARQALGRAEQAWLGLTGLAPPAALPAEETPARAPPIEAHPGMIGALAAAKAAQASLAAAQKNTREAPRVAVRIERDRGDFGEPFGNSIGIKLELPFSSGPQLRQQTAGALAETARTDAELELARRTIVLEIERARREIEAAQEQLQLTRERRDLTADTLQLAEKAFALGESDLLTLLRIRAAALEAQAAHDRQRTARAAAGSRLNQALGILP
ncbi:MAG: TolC family protein [Burkholderiales bacterium]|nr:TolC family protein [Burkholderiales bacterium]